MIMKSTVNWTVLVMVLMLATSIGISAEENKNQISVVPDHIQIGTFYHGTEITVSADMECSDGVVIVLEGDNEKVTFNRKGRVAFIWMNVAQITIEGIPQVYIMATSDALDNICDRKTRDDLKLGVESLRPLMKIESDRPLTGKEFDHFVKLKNHDGTYNTNNKVAIKSVSPGKSEVSATLPIPSKIPPGNYKIRVYCFRVGTPVEERSGNLTIERVGLPGLMINLATKNPAAYGLMAIIIAMSVGIIIGFIFDSLPGKGH